MKGTFTPTYGMKVPFMRQRFEQVVPSRGGSGLPHPAVPLAGVRPSRAGQGRLHPIPPPVKGTFTPTYGMKVPFMPT